MFISKKIVLFFIVSTFAHNVVIAEQNAFQTPLIEKSVSQEASKSFKNESQSNSSTGSSSKIQKNPGLNHSTLPPNILPPPKLIIPGSIPPSDSTLPKNLIPPSSPSAVKCSLLCQTKIGNHCYPETC